MIKKLGLFLVVFCTVCYARAEVLMDDIPSEYLDEYELVETEIIPELTDQTQTQSQSTRQTTSRSGITPQTSRAVVSGNSNQRAITSNTARQTTSRNTSQRQTGGTATSRETTSRSAVANTTTRSSATRATTGTRAATNSSRAAVSRTSSEPIISRSATSSRISTASSNARSAVSNSARSVSTNRAASRTKLIPAGYVSDTVNSSSSTSSSDDTLNTLNALKAKASLISSGVVTSGSGAASKSRSATTTTTLATKTIASTSDDKVDFETCKTNYFDCANQFCSVLNKTAKTCSCSTRITGFKTQEQNLEQATLDLYNVLQNITYVGYSAEEVKAMFVASEGELAIGEDTSENQQILKDINALLSGESTSSTSLFGGTNSADDMMAQIEAIANSYSAIDSSSDDISTKPEYLFAMAEESCQSILDTCEENSVDVESIKKLYNLGITTDCDNYGKTITNQISSMKKNLLAADTTLKKARLQALKDKNKYDFSQCVNALSECMMTDAICGSEYDGCLDMTGTVISSEGELIETANVSSLIYADEDDFRNWLISKIGTSKKEGVCRGVMDLCQKYTYKNDKYIDNNDVLISYIDSAVNIIKAKQTELTASYKSSCMTELSSCYKTNAKAIAVFDTNVSYDYVRDIVDAACYDIALSCAKTMYGESTTLCPENDDETCVKNISNVLLNSLNNTYSCHEGYGYDETSGTCEKCEEIKDTNNKYMVWSDTVGSCVSRNYDNCAELVADCVAEDNYCQQLASGGYDINKVDQCFSRCEYKDVCGGRPAGLCYSNNQQQSVRIGYIVGNSFVTPKRWASAENNLKTYPIIKEIVSLIDNYNKSRDGYWGCDDTSVEWDFNGDGQYTCVYEGTGAYDATYWTNIAEDCPWVSCNDFDVGEREARQPIKISSSVLGVCSSGFDEANLNFERVEATLVQ